jgi:hypothetical protein
MSGEEMLSGGTLTAVVRLGDTVRRTANVWSPSVHALLRHLEEKGFPGAPRFLGIDSQGRENSTWTCMPRRCRVAGRRRRRVPAGVGSGSATRSPSALATSVFAGP